MTPLERFQDKVYADPNSGCHIWTAALGSSGYGHFGMNGKVLDAHRVAYEFFNGPIPDGKSVLHSCDVKCCVNPHHLFLGTQTENLRDMTEKGRRSCGRGEGHGSAKLTAQQIKEIISNSRTHREIAVFYGVGKSTIGAIKMRKIWRTV
jgi:hypothetical protein